MRDTEREAELSEAERRLQTAQRLVTWPRSTPCSTTG